MTRNLTFGTAAVLGGVTAIVALLASVPTAKADEVADLRSNNQLLQQRLDQIAQGGAIPGVGGYYPGAGTNPAGNAAAIAGSFPRSFLIPGTDTSLRVGGQITEVMDYWFEGGNPNATPQSTTVGDNGQVQSIPIGGLASARSSNIFLSSPRESKISFETRTPTPYGEARTYMEWDWAGSTAYSPGGNGPLSVSDNLAPRLRFAYGTLGGWLVGQANSN
ncbi:MAG TPA: porin, partial [Bradyrhizobium sp.]|nr:porin [Bradyrhizobium sp.]